MIKFFAECQKELPIIRWLIAGFVLWFIDLTTGRLFFTEKGIPRNPASNTPGHSRLLAMFQKWVGLQVVRLQGASLHPAVVAYQKARSPEFNSQARLRTL